MAILRLKKYFSSIATYLEPKNTIFDQAIYLNYFLHSKMAILEYKNGHFEEIRAWLQILEWGSNSTTFYLTFDTHDSPGAIFIWKWEIYRPHLLVWRRSSSFLYCYLHLIRIIENVQKLSLYLRVKSKLGNRSLLCCQSPLWSSVQIIYVLLKNSTNSIWKT